jgi:IS5 family transposase
VALKQRHMRPWRREGRAIVHGTKIYSGAGHRVRRRDAGPTKTSMGWNARRRHRTTLQDWANGVRLATIFLRPADLAR